MERMSQLVPIAALVNRLVEAGMSFSSRMRPSLPIPGIAEKGLIITLLWGPPRCYRRPGELWRIDLDAQSGAFIELRGLTPASVGMSPRDGLDEGDQVDRGDAAAGDAEMFAAYDALLPGFGRDSLDRALKPTAAMFRRRFADLATAELGPAYEQIGRQFFAWLRRLDAA